VTVFRLVGRAEPKHPGVAEDQSKWDLLIQPMMEAPDAALPSPRSSGNGATARAHPPFRLAP
jgi:hypothetical protein